MSDIYTHMVYVRFIWKILVTIYIVIGILALLSLTTTSCSSLIHDYNYRILYQPHECQQCCGEHAHEWVGKVGHFAVVVFVSLLNTDNVVVHFVCFYLLFYTVSAEINFMFGYKYF